MALNQLWEDFKADTQAGYKFYSKDVDWESFEQHKRLKRRLYAGRALSWAMLRKLPPARRVFLLLIVAFAIFSLLNINTGDMLVVTLALLLLLALELADRVAVKRDLEIARDIQRSLVPAAAPSLTGVDIAFATRPANTVSGDYSTRSCAISQAETVALFLVVADVAGKSIPAALLMATIQASLRSLAVSSLSLCELVRGVNRYACANSLAGARFTPAFLAEWGPDTPIIAFVNAGHNPPIVKRSQAAMDRFEAGGLPLGSLPESRYDEGQIALAAGECW